MNNNQSMLGPKEKFVLPISQNTKIYSKTSDKAMLIIASSLHFAKVMCCGYKSCESTDPSSHKQIANAITVMIRMCTRDGDAS